MRRSASESAKGRAPTLGALAASVAILGALGAACGPHGAAASANGARSIVAPAPLATCPRDATPDATGRCACVDGTVAVEGACVQPAIADAFCGAGASFDVEGCAFHACPSGARLDVARGRCVGAIHIDGRDGSCGDHAASVVDEGRVACVSVDAACPRGTRASGLRCVRAPRCPPGSLVEGATCRPVVFGGGPVRRVDAGAWASLAIGVDGGPGSPDLCTPLARRGRLFLAVEADGTGKLAVSGARVEVAVRISFPDQDVSRVHADVRATDESGRPVSPDAARLVEDDVSSLVELLRALGGESTATSVDMAVHCDASTGEGHGASSPAADAGAPMLPP